MASTAPCFSLTRCTSSAAKEAYAKLRPVCDAFPDESGPLYNLAWICCALGQVEEAREWLAKALETGGEELKLQALDDEELAAVW
jgi:tetratricopeptide (TPR) repeat protein